MWNNAVRSKEFEKYTEKNSEIILLLMPECTEFNVSHFLFQAFFPMAYEDE